MQYLVAFCDLLGTAARIRSGSFNRLISLDFANPVGLAAMAAPAMRFAVFSDSCIFSCPPDEARSFVSVLAFLSRNWFADGMLVRGGVACGEVEWVDNSVDERFRQLTNLSFSRVFGVGLLDAYETEKSRPGAVIFIHESAIPALDLPTQSFVVQTSPPILNWYDERLARHYLEFLERSEHQKSGSAERQRQVEATHMYVKEVVTRGKFLPKGFEHEVLQAIAATSDKHR